MPQLHAHILGPIGADAVPTDLDAAITEYLSRRAELERRFEVEVPRRLGDNVEAGIRRIRSRANAPPGRGGAGPQGHAG